MGILESVGAFMPIICWPGQPLPLTQVFATKLAALMANSGHNDEKEGMDGLILEKLKADDNQVRQ